MEYITDKAVIVGAGNVAWHLTEGLEAIGIPVLSVYSRTKANAVLLAQRSFKAIATDQLDFSDSAANLFFLCVPDQAFGSVIAQLILPKQATIIHTSGSAPVSILKNNYTSQIGVFYPLQTFSKIKQISWEQTPIFVESPDENTLETLIRIANTLSKVVYEINDEERRLLHISAIFANNFVNHLLFCAENLLKQADLSLQLLKPLIEETINKAFRIGPFQAQTGPAVRADKDTILHHIDMLSQNGNAQSSKIYDLISRSIMKTYLEDDDLF